MNLWLDELDDLSGDLLEAVEIFGDFSGDDIFIRLLSNFDDLIDDDEFLVLSVGLFSVCLVGLENC